MFFASSIIGQWEKVAYCTDINVTVFMFLFMVCAFEVVLLKMTISPSVFTHDYHEGDDHYNNDNYGEHIYYEDIDNNYDHYARRRMRNLQWQQRQLEQQQQQQQQSTILAYS